MDTWVGDTCERGLPSAMTKTTHAGELTRVVANTVGMAAHMQGRTEVASAFDCRWVEATCPDLKPSCTIGAA